MSKRAGYRPVLVLSNDGYNQLTGLIIACPITSQAKGYPTEVPLPTGLQTTGVVLAGQVRTLDWQERKFGFMELASNALIEEVVELLGVIIEE